MDYVTLKADIALWTNVGASDALIDSCIRLAELDIYHGSAFGDPLRINLMRTAITLTPSAGIITIPGTVLDVLSVRRDGDPLRRSSVDYVLSGKNRDCWAISGSTLVVDGDVADTQTYDLDIYQREASMTDAGVWPAIGDMAYSALLYGASGHVLKHYEDDRADTWRAESARIVLGLNASDQTGLG